MKSEENQRNLTFPTMQKDWLSPLSGYKTPLTVLCVGQLRGAHVVFSLMSCPENEWEHLKITQKENQKCIITPHEK